MYHRLLDLEFTRNKSCLLFGPRQTGKSSLLKKTFEEATYIDLLLSEVYLKYSTRPQILREVILATKKSKLVVIDEIQRIPDLLNEVHYLIEEGYRFILTGSSARKLKRGSANLLAGRARTRSLFPLVSSEVPDFDLDKAINIGMIPSIYLSDEPLDDLESYVGTYLKEEIAQEGLSRGLQTFSRFLEFASLDNGELLNFSNISNDLGVSSNTVKSYYEILEDTLIGGFLRPYFKTKKRKPITKAKFYFFDVGVSNVLSKRFNIKRKSILFGQCFEHFLYCELIAYLSYMKDRRDLTFWRTKNGQEVDFLIGDDVAIEVKATENVQKKHTKGLGALSEEVPLKYKIIVSLESDKRFIEDDIIVYPCEEFLKDLWLEKFK